MQQFPSVLLYQNAAAAFAIPSIYSDYADQSTSDGLPPKPLISLSGDDDGKHYVLYPENPGGDRSDFSYDLYLLVDSGGNTAGTMAVRDLDGDGYVEIVSAGYSAGEVREIEMRFFGCILVSFIFISGLRAHLRSLKE